MDSLSRIFGSAARLKVLRLYLFNDDMSFTLLDTAERTKASKEIVRKELNALVTAGVLKKKAGKGPAQFVAHRRFPYFDQLQTFIRSTTNLSDTDMVASLKKAGNLRLVAVSGFFTGAVDTKVDLLVVGDKLDDKALETSMRALEAELGREIRFATFSTEVFTYRRGVYDRLLRDIFDFPHRILLDKIGM